jgi:hypothetical protein
MTRRVKWSAIENFAKSPDQMNRDAIAAKPSDIAASLWMSRPITYSHILSGAANETGGFVAAPDAQSWP